ncbi:hypothetical protein LWI28_019767 [Acer negundo]|uniref:Uncharacterized protein n=1 Tax=Acer negundo TaxID=4023 RepID=A0AAD5NW71_ACENE|nr:hypothetical protein LWI28_019767 [Acer negundo]
MGSAVLNKPPSPFITFIYCFLLISSLFYIPHRIVAEYEKDGASSVHGSSPKHDSNAVGQVPPKKSSPTQNNPTSQAGSAVVDCGRGNSYRSYGSCLPGPKKSSNNSRGGLYPGRH